MNCKIDQLILMVSLFNCLSVTFITIIISLLNKNKNILFIAKERTVYHSFDVVNVYIINLYYHKANNIDQTKSKTND